MAVEYCKLFFGNHKGAVVSVIYSSLKLASLQEYQYWGTSRYSLMKYVLKEQIMKIYSQAQSE